MYTGGEQEVPRDVKRVRIAENIDTIPARVFNNCRQLIEVEGHDKIKKIERGAFYCCTRLRSVTKMTSLIEIEVCAFSSCKALRELEFDKLEIIGDSAFNFCESLRSISMPSVRRVDKSAFSNCSTLMDAVFGRDLERIEGNALKGCDALSRISIPLKHGMIAEDNIFNRCDKLSNVDVVVGGIHTTISSLHMESWRDEMGEEIDRINQTLPNILADLKTRAIQQWITRVLSRMEHYKSEHKILVKEAMTLIELALWKAKLLNEADEKKCNVDVVTKKAKIDSEAARKEHRLTCGASIVIKTCYLSLH